MATGGGLRRWGPPAALGAAVVVALVVALAVAAVVVSSSDDGPARRGVFVIGDSITVMAGGTHLGPASWEVDARSGRATHEGIEVAKAHDLSERAAVIVALGTNDHSDTKAAYARQIDAMMAAIGPGPDVIWVNVDSHTPELADASDGVNAALLEAPGRYPNLRVADWDTYVEGLGSVAGLRAGDGIHYGRGGSALRRTWMVALGPSDAPS